MWTPVNKISQNLPNTPVCQDQWMPCYLPVPRLWMQNRSQYPIPVKCEFNISCNLLSIHTNSQAVTSKSIWATRRKSIGNNMDQGTIYNYVPNLKNLWPWIQNKAILMSSSNSFVRGQNHKITLGYLCKMSPGRHRWIQTMVIRTGGGYWFCLL